MKKKANEFPIGSYCVIRAYRAGVWAGTVEAWDGAEKVTLTNARRIWYWSGAATLSELAERGTSKPRDCKFPAAVRRVVVLDACEIIEASDAGRASIEAVPVWSV
jgi:hypothetical protein